MRPVLCFVLLCCAAPAAGSRAYGQEFPYKARVAADGLPIHAGPLADDYVTATLPRGTEVTVVRHDPGGRAMIQAPAGAVSFAKLEWLTMTAGTAEGGGTATVTATGNELYCRVGSRVGEAPMIEQVPLKAGQAVTVQGTRSLPGPNGPEVWAQIPSPRGEHRWASLRYLSPDNVQARADRDRDPYAVPADLPFYRFVMPEAGTFLGCEAPIVSHTGYTGEAGVEIYCSNEEAPRVWDALMEAGAARGLLPAGLGARDTLRLESGFCLYGHELDDETTPLEAGLGWVTKLDASDFVGADALREQKEAGVPRKLVGFVVEGRGIPREGYPILDARGETVGVVTSGTQSPVLGQGIGLGLVQNVPELTAPGSELTIQVRGRELTATVRKPPFHKGA